jgi:prepilin-type N-terminal cleavage/methylation domain-containing protein/prepilin-type processing-associated H-X9-DG protein
MNSNRYFARAFTLVELLVVMAVIAILMTIAYPVYTGIIERGKATKDLSNLRQIGIATQSFMNDNDGVLFSSTASWMSQLNPKYLSSWGVFQSPFDKRTPSEAGTSSPVSPISYGINSNIYPPPNNIVISGSRITNPTGFILFAPAQDDAATVNFQGLATTAAPGVSLVGTSNTVKTTNPLAGGSTAGGTHSNRTRVNALFGDLHCENMLWTAFISTATSTPNFPDQWTPYKPYP